MHVNMDKRFTKCKSNVRGGGEGSAKQPFMDISKVLNDIFRNTELVTFASIIIFVDIITAVLLL